MQNNNEKDLESMIDEVLESYSESEKVIQSEIPLDELKTEKESAHEQLFGKPNSLDIFYPENKPSSPPSAKQTKKEEQQLKKEYREYKNFDEEINYRNVLDKLMKKVTPTKPFEFKLEEENFIFEEDKDGIGAEFDSFPDEMEELSKTSGFTGISVRTYSTSDVKENKSNFPILPYLYINKLMFFTMLIIFGICALETAATFLFFRNMIKMNFIFYLVLILVSLVPLGIGIFTYAFAPEKRVKRNINFVSILLNTLIIVSIAVVLLLIIALTTSTSFLDPAEFLPRIVIPFVFILNLPLSVWVYYLLYKSERFFS